MRLTLHLKLRFASGSLAQFLHVRYSATLPSSSTVDAVEETLKNFIPSDYLTSEDEFLSRVEKDADEFKPYGEKIYSYTRAATTLTKGKNVAIPQVLSPEDQETVDFEVYHVSSPVLCSVVRGAFGGNMKGEATQARCLALSETI